MAPPPRKGPTQREVARLAGVSQAAVSQVLNGGVDGIRIPDATRQRVLQAMQEIGYVPNVAARRLAGGHNRILGVFTYEPVFPTSTRDFFTPFLEGIEEAAAELDYDLLLHTRPGPQGGRRAVYHDGASRLRLADGTVMLGLLDEQRREDLAQLVGGGHPTVFIGRRDLPGQDLPYVTADYAAATAQACAALLARGHRHTLYLGTLTRHESAVDRELGYRRALRHDPEHGRVERVETVTPELVAGALRVGVTGVLCENERLTAEWIAVAQALGHRWPQDYGFAVLGDPIYQGELPAGWAHVTIPRLEMGREAVRLLAQLLAGVPAPPRILPCRWVPAASLGGNASG
ncbi:DNA-binding LacI/PurR family transcriptional regulator [Deinococcus metalli]|uniref:DNA-binding LacI/PurR family transcriptional regulator n=1 Tax=Deinococcus metalli TaxID=1141878 RepID=A0A7W8KD72_9DEIO|nr:LacI family DNA-binding transcriptional regulator [Deinococcus metalli]MBB5375795.1 DNA-binding LacI/PurR family transcriptional regulator [Deinococcus metalli]GHF36988.1 LacI family transcriptional regulator [Deinococcus metalli]